MKSPKRRQPAARLLYAASETDADILYPTGFFAPDPFLFVQKGDTRVLVMSDLELDRARSQASVDRVLSWSRIAAPAEKDGRKAPPSEVIALALRQLGLARVEVPQSFPLGLAMELDARGIRLDFAPTRSGPSARRSSRARCARSSSRCAPPRPGSRPASRRCAPAACARAGCGATAGSSRPRTCAGGQHAHDGRRLPALAHDLRARRPGRRPARGGPRPDPRAHAGRDGHLPAREDVHHDRRVGAIGPWPSSCGSTAWSPCAQIVCAGM